MPQSASRKPKQTAVHTGTFGSSVPPLAYSGERYLSGPGNGKEPRLQPNTPYCAHDLNHGRTCPLVPTAKVQHTLSW